MNVKKSNRTQNSKNMVEYPYFLDDFFDKTFN